MPTMRSPQHNPLGLIRKVIKGIDDRRFWRDADYRKEIERKVKACL